VPLEPFVCGLDAAARIAPEIIVNNVYPDHNYPE
jgi:hypothetical protein